MSWIVLAILAGIASNAFNFFSRFILKGNDDETAYAWYFEFVRFISFGIIAIVDWKIILTSYSVILFFLLALSEAISSYWYMKMHKYTQLSISTIISRTRLLWVPVLAFLILREHLQLLDYVGIIVLFFGISITSAPQKVFLDKGVKYANLSAFMIAFNIVLTKMALPFASNSVLNGVMVVPSVIIFPLLMKDAKKRIIVFLKKRIVLKSCVMLINVASVYLYTQALRVGDVSKVTAIYQGMMILSVLAGIIILKETKDVKKKIVGALVTLAGVILLTSI